MVTSSVVQLSRFCLTCLTADPPFGRYDRRTRRSRRLPSSLPIAVKLRGLASRVTGHLVRGGLVGRCVGLRARDASFGRGGTVFSDLLPFGITIGQFEGGVCFTSDGFLSFVVRGTRHTSGRKMRWAILATEAWACCHISEGRGNVSGRGGS